jgi:hypothetical protein
MRVSKSDNPPLGKSAFLVLELRVEHAKIFTILWCQSHGNRISGLLGPLFRSMHGAIHVPRDALTKALAGGCASPEDLTAGSPAPMGVLELPPIQKKNNAN